MDIEIPELNVASGLKLCDGDTKLYLRALRLYASKVPDSLEKMRKVSEMALKDYTAVVHDLKSNSVYVGAEDVRKTAGNLEAMSKAGNLAGILAENGSFIQYTENLLGIIQNWLRKYDASQA